MQQPVIVSYATLLQPSLPPSVDLPPPTYSQELDLLRRATDDLQQPPSNSEDITHGHSNTEVYLPSHIRRAPPTIFELCTTYQAVSDDISYRMSHFFQPLLDEILLHPLLQPHVMTDDQGFVVHIKKRHHRIAS